MDCAEYFFWTLLQFFTSGCKQGSAGIRRQRRTSLKSVIGNQQTLQGAGLPHYSHKRYIQRDSHHDNSPRLQSNQEAKPTQPENRQSATTK